MPIIAKISNLLNRIINSRQIFEDLSGAIICLPRSIFTSASKLPYGNQLLVRFFYDIGAQNSTSIKAGEWSEMGK